MMRFAVLAACALSASAVAVRDGAQSGESALNALSAQLATSSPDDDAVLAHMLATVDKRFKVEQATAHRAFVEQNEFCRAKTRFLLRREAELEDVAKHIEKHGLTQQRMAVERARGELAQAKHVLHGIQRDMRMLDAEEEHGEARAVAEQARVAQAQEHVKFGQHNLRIVKSLIPSASAEEDPHALLRALAPTALVEVAAGGDGTEEDVATRQKLLRRVVEDLDASLAARKSHLDRTSKASSTAVEDDTTVLGLERSVLAKARRTLDERVARSERAVRDARANAEGERTVLSQALLARHMVHQRRQLFVHACEAYGAAFETASHYRARIASQVDEAQYFLSHSSRTTNLPAYLRSMQARVAEAEAAVHAAVERQTAALEALAAERDRIFHPHRPAQPRAATGAAPTGGASTGGASTGGASTGAAEAAPAPARKRDGHGVAHADEGPKAAEPERVYVPPYVKPVGRPTGTASVEAFKASVTGATGSAGRGDDESAAVSSVEEANARVMRSVADGDELVITGPMLGGLLATGPGDHGLAPTGTAAMTSDGVVVMVRAAVVKGLADGAAADADKAGLVAAVRAEVGRAVSAYVSSATGGSALAYPATPESGATEVLAGPYAEYTPAVLAAVERALSLPHVRQGRPTEIVAAVMTAVEVALDAQPTGATGVFVRGHYESVPASKAAGPVAADTPVAEQKPTAEAKDGADRKRVEPKRPAAAVPTGATGAAPTGPAHEATGATGAGSVAMPTRALTAEEEEAVRTAQHRLQGAAAQAETDAARVAGKVALAAGKLESAEHAAAAREDSAEAAVEAARAAKDAAERAAARAAAARADLKRARAAKSALATKTAEVAAAKREARSKAERAERRAADLEALAARVRALVLGAGAPGAEAEPEAAAPTGTGATGLFLPSMPATGGAATEADVAAALARVTAKHGRGAETGGVVPSFGYDAASDAARAGGAGVAAGGSLLELLSSGSEAAEEEAVRADAARLGVKLPRDLAHADATLREAAAAAEEEAEREASRALALGAKLAKLEKEQEAAVEAVATLEQAVTAADADAEKAAEEARSVDSDGAEAELEAAEAAAERVSAEIKAQRGAQSAAEEAARELRVLAEEAMGATGATGGGATGAEALVQEGRAVMAEAEEEMAAIRDEFLTEAPGAGAGAASLGGATGAASMLEPTAAEAEAEAEAEAQAERASATGGETGATGAAASVEAEAAEARAERAAEEEQRAAAWAAAWEADREERAAEAEEVKTSATGSASDEHRARVEELLREAYAAARDAHDAHRDVESPKEVREMAAAIDAEAEARAATGGATGGASADAGEKPAVQSATGSAEQPAAAQPTGAPATGAAATGAAATGAAATGAASVPGRVGVIHFVGHRAEEGDMCLQLSGATHQGEENHSGYLELWEHMPGHEDAQRWLHREDHALCLADFPTYCLAPRAPREAFGVARRPMTAEVPDAGVAGSAQLGASADFAGFRLRGTSVTLAATDVAAWTFTGDGRLCLASRRELCLTVQEEAGNDVAVVLEEATPEALDEQGWLFDSA